MSCIMMKKIITPFLLFAVFIAQGQFTGKPIYNIRVERADTLLGNIEVELFPNIAPLHVANWDSIVNAGGYDSTAFHRVVPGFVIQGGDPNSVNGPVSTWGQGDPNQATVDAEFSEVPHARGILSAARSTDINSASSQFFICHQNAFSLDNNYSVYGNTISGMDIVDIIVNAPTASGTERPEEKIYMIVTRTGSNDSVPDAPTLISPADAATGTSSNTSFSWSSIQQAHLYLFEIATDANFNNIVFSKETKNTSATYNQLADGYTTHYWRVRANNGGHYSVGGEERTFESGIGTPTLILPEDAAETGTKPFLDWSDVNGSSTYRLLVSTSASFGNPNLIIIDTIVNGSEYKFQTDIAMNFSHYWKVAAMNDAEELGDYAPKRYFRATQVSNLENEIIHDSYSIYPNPFKDHVVLEAKEEGIIILADIQGKEVYRNKVVVGANTLDLSLLKSGLYLYSIHFLNTHNQGKLNKN